MVFLLPKALFITAILNWRFILFGLEQQLSLPAAISHSGNLLFSSALSFSLKRNWLGFTELLLLFALLFSSSWTTPSKIPSLWFLAVGILCEDPGLALGSFPGGSAGRGGGALTAGRAQCLCGQGSTPEFLLSVFSLFVCGYGVFMTFQFTIKQNIMQERWFAPPQCIGITFYFCNREPKT